MTPDTAHTTCTAHSSPRAPESPGRKGLGIRSSRACPVPSPTHQAAPSRAFLTRCLSKGQSWVTLTGRARPSRPGQSPGRESVRATALASPSRSAAPRASQGSPNPEPGGRQGTAYPNLAGLARDTERPSNNPMAGGGKGEGSHQERREARPHLHPSGSHGVTRWSRRAEAGSKQAGPETRHATLTSRPGQRPGTGGPNGHPKPPNTTPLKTLSLGICSRGCAVVQGRGASLEAGCTVTAPPALRGTHLLLRHGVQVLAVGAEDQVTQDGAALLGHHALVGQGRPDAGVRQVHQHLWQREPCGAASVPSSRCPPPAQVWGWERPKQPPPKPLKNEAEAPPPRPGAGAAQPLCRAWGSLGAGENHSPPATTRPEPHSHVQGRGGRSPGRPSLGPGWASPSPREGCLCRGEGARGPVGPQGRPVHLRRETRILPSGRQGGPGPRERAPPARRQEGGGRCRHEEIHGLRPRHAGAHSASSRPLRATLQVSLAALTKQKYLISSESRGAFQRRDSWGGRLSPQAGSRGRQPTSTSAQRPSLAPHADWTGQGRPDRPGEHPRLGPAPWRLGEGGRPGRPGGGGGEGRIPERPRPPPHFRSAAAPPGRQA